MQRSTFNGVTGGITAFSFLGLILNWVGRAADVGDLFTIIRAEWFNPVAALNLVFFVGLALLIARNFDLAQQSFRRWRKSNARDWDTTACEAVFYIAGGSTGGLERDVDGA